MKAKYKGPGGTGVLELPDDASVGQLFSEISKRTGIEKFTLKYGWPPKTLGLDQSDTAARSLGLHGENLTIVPTENPSGGTASQTQPPVATSSRSVTSNAPAAAKPSVSKPRHSAESPEDVTIPWSSREGTLLLRVMPSDNSCLFTAFGGALDKQIPAQRLRTMVAEYIMAHPEEYPEVVLAMPPEKYCRNIQGKDHWGGAIELGIFSNMFDIEICAFDVKEQNLIQFGEHKASRCVLVYSGIHYDRVAFSLSDPPFRSSTLPPELDTTIWDTSDDEILIKAADLVKELNRIHYYTDPGEILLKCDATGCDWIGSGQREGSKHAEQTGHTALSEVEDTSLLKCNSPGCDWLGSGEKEASKHRSDTGHTSWSVIPDF